MAKIINEMDSLILLANVALDRSDYTTRYLKRIKEPKMKALKICHLNGKKHADIDDLKNIPISILFKIFFEQYEDVKHHSTVILCKFGLKNHCNTKFIVSKENKVSQLEHLAICHLLEHLIKTKSGSLVKIPEVSKSFQYQITSIKKPSNIVKNILCEKNVTSNSPAVPLKCERKVISENLNSKNNENLKFPKMKSVNINSDSYCLIANNVSDSSSLISENLYSGKVFNNSTLISKEHDYFEKKRKYIHPLINPKKKVCTQISNLDVDNLYYINNEPSNDLIEFMIHETLCRPTKIFVLDGTKLVIEDLPLVGSEVEINAKV